MTLVWDWPTNWTPFTEKIRDVLQVQLRKQLRDNPTNLIRGNVEIEELNFGTTPPTVSLRRIHELSEHRIKIDAYVKYAGNGYVKIRGLDINLDAVTPFFCPFEMVMCDVVFEDILTIEVQVLEKPGQRKAATPVTPATTAVGVSSNLSPASSRSSFRAPLPPRRTSSPTGSTSTTGSSIHHHRYPSHGTTTASLTNSTGVVMRSTKPGVALSLAARNWAANAMRQSTITTTAAVSSQAAAATASRPNDVVQQDVGASPARSSDVDEAEEGVADNGAAPATANSAAPSAAAAPTKRIIVRFWDAPLKDFRVRSNFNTVSGTDKKIETTLWSLLKPALENLKAQGIQFDV
eukprot:PhM_4_TR10366/c0_g1_i1/m.27431